VTLLAPVVATKACTATDDNCAAENDMFVAIDEILTPNETLMASRINALDAAFDDNAESLIQVLR